MFGTTILLLSLICIFRSTLGMVSPLKIVKQYHSSSAEPPSSSSMNPNGKSRSIDDATHSLQKTVIHVPSTSWSDDVVYKQTATSMQITGSFEDVSSKWDCGSELVDAVDGGVECSIGEISLVAQDTVILKWNVSWTPPSAAWLNRLGHFWPGVTVVPRPYTDKSRDVSVFSWSSVFRLFATAFKEGRLTVPLAVIEGRSLLRFSNSTSADDEGWKLTSITEELSYAEDLKRNVLQNRRCAEDLRLFLELGRKPSSSSWTEWEDLVKECLPWGGVPGSGALDIEPMADDEGNAPAIIFLFVTFAAFLLFANFLAPELIGQHLFGPPNYIVDPSELGSLF